MVKNPVADFWDNIDCLLEENSYFYVISRLLRETRQMLSDTSATARRIDQKWPLVEIADSAEQEGLTDFAAALHFIVRSGVATTEA